jgi:hypothetical protein
MQGVDVVSTSAIEDDYEPMFKGSVNGCRPRCPWSPSALFDMKPKYDGIAPGAPNELRDNPRVAGA